MVRPNSRSELFCTILIVHAVGLFAAGVVGTIGTTAGFSLSGGGIGLFLGGLISIPWLAGIAVLIWFYGSQIERHPIAFALIGPLMVVGSYNLIVGAFWESVAVSCTVSSACYLPLAYWRSNREAASH
jgi:hypothetical protein